MDQTADQNEIESDEQVTVGKTGMPVGQLQRGFFAGALLAFAIRFIQVFHFHGHVETPLLDFLMFSVKGGVWVMGCSRLWNAQVPRFLGILVVVFGLILVVPWIESPMGVVPLGTAYLLNDARSVVYLINHLCVSIVISIVVDKWTSC